MYGGEYQAALTSLVKNRRSVQEFLDNPELKQELKNVTECYDEEMKKKRKEEKDAQRLLGKEEVDDEPSAEAEDEEAEESEAQKLNHLLVGGNAPSLPFKEPKDGMTEKGQSMKEKLNQFKKMAVRKVPCLKNWLDGLIEILTIII